MAKYELTYHCEHVETLEVEANNIEEAMLQLHNWDCFCVQDWHIEGNKIVDSIKKNGNDIKQFDKAARIYLEGE